MICLNNANNPTGTLLNKAFLQQVVELAKTVGAYILIDEVYQPLNDLENFTSIVDLYDRGIATNSLSKTYPSPESASAGLSLAMKSLIYLENTVTTP
jgi:Aspartate/tyrosine/aromatic aminotransferase